MAKWVVGPKVLSVNVSGSRNGLKWGVDLQGSRGPSDLEHLWWRSACRGEGTKMVGRMDGEEKPDQC